MSMVTPKVGKVTNFQVHAHFACNCIFSLPLPPPHLQYLPTPMSKERAQYAGAFILIRMIKYRVFESDRNNGYYNVIVIIGADCAGRVHRLSGT